MEEWRDVKGYEGYYQVSNLGNVRSLSRSVPGKGGAVQQIKGQVMKTYKFSRTDYHYVDLSLSGVKKRYLVHRLVYQAFHGDIPHRYDINHKNGVKGDNRATNIEALTRSDNHLHSINTLNRWPDNRGSKHGMSKLTEDMVREIRALASIVEDGNRRKHSNTDISIMFGITRSYAADIIRGKAWKHI